MTNQTVDEGAIRVAKIPFDGPAPHGSIRICPVTGKISLTPTTLPSLTSGRGACVEPMPAVQVAGSPVLVVASPEISMAAQDRCACGHLLEHHDRIAARYCAATTAGELSRDCICSPTTDA